MVSKTGAEGLDLKNLRSVCALEPYWSMSRFDQLKSRGIRIGAMNDLPKELREVQPVLLVATPNTSVRNLMPEESKEKMSVDEMFLHNSQNKSKLNNSFKDALIEVSLECDKSCRECEPTGRKLYTDDAEKDVLNTDPCIKLNTNTSEAVVKVIGNKKYAMIITDIARFYQYDEKYDSYIEIMDDETIDMLSQKFSPN